jgi:hypothetical protein
MTPVMPGLYLGGPHPTGSPTSLDPTTTTYRAAGILHVIVTWTAGLSGTP